MLLMIGGHTVTLGNVILVKGKVSISDDIGASSHMLNASLIKTPANEKPVTTIIIQKTLEGCIYKKPNEATFYYVN